jgi:hypothetical protein
VADCAVLSGPVLAGSLLSADAIHRDGQLLRNSATRLRYALLLRPAMLLRRTLLRSAGPGRAELGRAVLRAVGVGGGHAVPVSGGDLAGELRLVTRVPHLVALHGRAVPGGGYRGRLLRSGLRLRWLPADLLPGSLLPRNLLSGHLLRGRLLLPALLEPTAGLLPALLEPTAGLLPALLGPAMLLACLLLSRGLLHRGLLRPEPGRKRLRGRRRRSGRQTERGPGRRPGHALCAGSAARAGVHETGSARSGRDRQPTRHPGPGSTGDTSTSGTRASGISRVSSASRPARTHAARGPGLSGETSRRASRGRGTGAARTTGTERAAGAHSGHLPSRSDLPSRADRATRASRPGRASWRASVARRTSRSGRSARTRAQRRPSRAARHPPRIARVQRPCHGRKQHRHRELVPFLLQVPHLLPGDDNLEHAAVDLPVTELPGAPFIHAEVDDVQPVAEVVQDEARLTTVVADRAGLPQRADLAELDVLAPDAAGRRGEAVLLGRRRGGEKGDVAVGGTHGSLV